MRVIKLSHLDEWMITGQERRPATRVGNAEEMSILVDKSELPSRHADIPMPIAIVAAQTLSKQPKMPTTIVA